MDPYRLLFAALVFRTVTVLCGFASLYLGYQLFIRGIFGESDVEGSHHSTSIKVKRAAPGIFFCCLGAAVMIVAIWHTPIRLEQGPEGTKAVVQSEGVTPPIEIKITEPPKQVVEMPTHVDPIRKAVEAPQ